MKPCDWLVSQYPYVTPINNIEPSVYGGDAPYGKLLWPLVIVGHAYLHSRTDSQAPRAEYYVVGIPHNTAI